MKSLGAIHLEPGVLVTLVVSIELSSDLRNRSSCDIWDVKHAASERALNSGLASSRACGTPTGLHAFFSDRGVVRWEMTSGSDGPAQLGVQRLDGVRNRYEDPGARSSGRDSFSPGVWCDHPGRGAPGARQWAGRSVR
jgi:hypothetical protein